MDNSDQGPLQSDVIPSSIFFSDLVVLKLYLNCLEAQSFCQYL